jgi:hypothetical protein
MRITSVTVALVVALASPGGAQSADSARADSAFRRQDWKTAAEVYGRLTAQAASNGQAWMRLGIARHSLNDLDGAMRAFERTLELQPQQPQATFRLARLHALKGNSARSLDYLEALVPLRAVPFTIVDTVSDLLSLRTQPRYVQLMQRMRDIQFPCRTRPEARQFDFWVGDWDVTPWQAPPSPSLALIGTNRIELVLEQCMLIENWTGGGSSGKSINFWDTNRRQWRQVWVADGGGSLDYAGSFRDGAMRFDGWTLSPAGTRVMQRLTFFPIHRDTVRQLFETSADSGKTWQPGFDGRYARRKR